MCKICYEEYTKDGVPPMTLEMAELMSKIKEIYTTEWGTVGGPLHVQIEDMNVMDWLFDDDHSQAMDINIEMNFPTMGPADRALCHEVFSGLRGMTKAQRAEVIWRAQGAL